MWKIRLHNGEWYEHHNENMPTLREVEKEPNRINFLEIDGKYYRWMMTDEKEKMFFVKEVDMIIETY